MSANAYVGNAAREVVQGEKRMNLIYQRLAIRSFLSRSAAMGNSYGLLGPAHENFVNLKAQSVAAVGRGCG
jgi:hypothetical protein